MRSGLCLVLSFILLLVVACTTKDDLSSTQCTTPCYSGRPSTQGVGICHAGMPVCDAAGNLTGCEGAQLPSYELCNGLDDDCDGIVDEGALGTGSECSVLTAGLAVGGDSRCRAGVQICYNAAALCASEVGPAAEACNGVDDDCNGLIDDHLTAIRTCYSGSLQDLIAPRSACQAGVETCVNGHLGCFGEVLPAAELCNGVDDDCDGIVDDGAKVDAAVPIDIMLLVDTSGSMQSRISQLRAALLDVLGQHNDPLYRYGLVLVPSRLSDTVEYVHDLTDATTLRPYVGLLEIGIGSLEDSYDATVWCVDGTYNISWRSNALHYVIFFGDEFAQSSFGRTEMEVALRLASANAVFVGFVRDDPEYQVTYDDIAALTGGEIFSIDLVSSEMSRLLVQTLQSPCMH